MPTADLTGINEEKKRGGGVGRGEDIRIWDLLPNLLLLSETQLMSSNHSVCPLISPLSTIRTNPHTDLSQSTNPSAPPPSSPPPLLLPQPPNGYGEPGRCFILLPRAFPGPVTARPTLPFLPDFPIVPLTCIHGPSSKDTVCAFPSSSSSLESRSAGAVVVAAAAAAWRERRKSLQSRSGDEEEGE